MPVWCRELQAAGLAASVQEPLELARVARPEAQAEQARARPDWCNLPWAWVLQSPRTIPRLLARLALSTKLRLWPINESTVCLRCNRTPDRQALPTRRPFQLEPVLLSNSTTAARPPTVRSSICLPY